MRKGYFVALLIIGLLPNHLSALAYNNGSDQFSSAFTQDTISSKYCIKAGVGIIPGLSLSWASKDIGSLSYSEGKSINTPFLSKNIYVNFYFNGVFLSGGILISSESFGAIVSLPLGQGSHYEIEYKGRYIDFPFGIGFILNNNHAKNESFLEIRTALSFIFYEKIKKFSNYSYYNQDFSTKKIGYNRTYFLITLGRETPFIRNTPLNFKIALTLFTSPVYIRRNTTEIFTNTRLGIDLGFTYKIKHEKNKIK